MLGVTKALEKADYSVPIRYDSVIDSLRVSCGLLHERLSFVDPEVEEEFREKEHALNRRIGAENFYDKSEIEELKQKEDSFENTNKL